MVRRNASTQRDIIPRAFEHMFTAIAVTANTNFLVHASYPEIHDLLGPDVEKPELKESNDSGVRSVRERTVDAPGAQRERVREDHEKRDGNREQSTVTSGS